MNSNVSRLPDTGELDDELTLVDYVAGHMTVDAAAEFEARLAREPELAEKVAEERALRAAVQDALPAEPVAAEAFESLRAELEPRRPGRLAFGGIAAGFVAAIALAFVIQQPDADFETLSDDGAMPVQATSSVRVVFAADSDETARRQVAERFGFTIVSGPGAGNAYLVDTGRAVSRDALIEWRADPRIDLAEPVGYAAEP